ncbi:MAG: tRNA pseudouridine(13) synthase TruD [Gammaproteobacteria bacterium]
MRERPGALIRENADDFKVTELPKVMPDGRGEHLLVRVRKRDANTQWVAAQLARWAGVPARAVSFAGMKDRRAVTEQWFSIHCFAAEPDPDALDAAGTTILEVHRHSRKLRRGALNGNRFAIVLRELTEDAELIAARSRSLADGVPNRFGPQRFGRGGRNLVRAQRWFDGGAAPRDRTQRAMMISAARSALFNEILEVRVEDGNWATPLDGDIMTLDRRGSRFTADFNDDTLLSRCAAGEIHPSGPLWGEGGSEATGAAAQVERSVIARNAKLAAGLEHVATADRRPLRAMPRDVKATVIDSATLRLEFELPPGAYATSVLDELVEWRVPDDTEGEPDAGED